METNRDMTPENLCTCGHFRDDHSNRGLVCLAHDGSSLCGCEGFTEDIFAETYADGE